MSKLSASEFMNSVKTFIGDRDDDEALKFLEDCKDTITEEKDDWKAKYEAEVKAKEELDKSWRTKYHDTFFSSEPISNKNENTNEHAQLPDERTDAEKKAESIKIDDLFKSE